MSVPVAENQSSDQNRPTLVKVFGPKEAQGQLCHQRQKDILTHSNHCLTLSVHVTVLTKTGQDKDKLGRHLNMCGLGTNTGQGLGINT